MPIQYLYKQVVNKLPELNIYPGRTINKDINVRLYLLCRTNKPVDYSLVRQNKFGKIFGVNNWKHTVQVAQNETIFCQCKYSITLSIVGARVRMNVDAFRSFGIFVLSTMPQITWLYKRVGPTWL